MSKPEAPAPGSARRRGRRLPRAQALALSAAVAALMSLGLACGGEEEEAGFDCFNGDMPMVPAPPEQAIRLGRVTLTEEVAYDAAGQRTDTTFLTASFIDVTQVEISSRQPSPIGTPGCYGLTGAVATVCRDGFTAPCTKEYMAADEVTLAGLAAGPVSLEPRSPGNFARTDVAAPLFGTEPISVAVTGATAPGELSPFPSYEQTVSPPDPLELRGSPPDPTVPLGSQDLELSWEPGNGDYVVIDISHVDSQITDKIQCIVADDGCHAIQVGDLEFFDFLDGTSMRVTLKREKSVVTPLDDTTAVELTAASEVEMLLLK